MDLFYRGCSYFKHLILSGNQHSLHSPFLFYLYNTAINTRKEFYAFEPIESLRKKSLNNHKVIEVCDLGAGSTSLNNKIRSISDITKISVKNTKTSQLLFRMAWFMKPNNIVELGTSLGFTSAYLASANPKSRLYTFEGCPETANLAQNNLQRLKLENIEIVRGNIDITLEPKLEKLTMVDMAFIDANHRYEPTLRYFNQLINKCHEGSFMVFDDIHWSKEMGSAWKEIIQDQRVTISLDLFHVGIIFFRKNAPKQHFKLKGK